jgi:VWFA-related protein
MLTLWLASEPARAQGPIVVALDSVEGSAHPAMRAWVTVTDDNGVPVRELDPKAFALSEDSLGASAPDKVEAVVNQKAAVSVMLVIDLSGSMRGRPLQAAREAIVKFMQALLDEAGDPDRAAFIGFTQTVTVTADSIADEKREVAFTNDMGKLLNVINFVDVDTGTGGTPLYDALFRAVRITSQQPDRRAIVLMTDGQDKGSTLADSDPIGEANRQHIPIFTIGLSTGRLDAQYLQRVALRTGGQYQSAPTPDQLAQLLQNVLAQLKEQYLLTYTSRIPKPDGQPHTLTVQVNSPRGSGSSKLTFTLGQPIATATVAATPTVIVPTVTPPPSPAPTLTATPQPVSSPAIPSFLQNPALVVAIVAAGLLLLLIVVVGIILIARGRHAAMPTGDRASYQATWSSQDPPRTQPPFEAKSIPPPAAPPVGPSTAPPAPPVTSGSTVIIQRGSKSRVQGMLMSKQGPAWQFRIDKPSMTIGRAPGNDLVVEHPTVSRQHATIKIEGGEFRLYDLGSSNGTFVNEQRVREPVALRDGAAVRFGEARFVFSVLVR